MNKLFISTEEERLYKAYTKEDIGGSYAVTVEQFMLDPYKYKDVEYMFTTWCAPELSEAELEEYLPNLKAVFYAAGTVLYFAEPYLNRGIRVFSAWKANAIPVAEFTVAQIILANKGYYQGVQEYRRSDFDTAIEVAEKFNGNYRTNVGIIGLGSISRHVIELLQSYEMNIYVWSDFMSEEEAAQLKVKKASLDEIFENCDVISNHLPDKECLRGLLNYELFSKMKKTAAFINTGRGAQVDEEGLVRAMKEEPLRTALLDVTEPEPTEPDSPLWTSENIIISPHRAGAYTREILRLSKYMFDEYARLLNGEETKYEITKDMLSLLA